MIGVEALLATVLGYAKQGMRVFPCMPNSKIPITKHGSKDATTDEAQIRRWWSNRRWDYNVAIATGSASSMFVIDLDVRPSYDGRAAWAELGGVVHPHATHTPRGGVHLYYRLPPGMTVRNSASRLGAGIDVRGDGGYVLAPPSHIDGVAYSGAPTLIEAPAWLLARLASLSEAPSHDDGPRPPSRGMGMRAPNSRRRDAYGDAALRGAADEIAAARDGQRNEKLNKQSYSIGGLVGSGYLDEGRAMTALIDAAIAAGLPLGEAQRTVRSGMSSGIAHPWEPDERPRSDPVESGDPPHDDDWRRQLRRTEEGCVKATPANIDLILAHDPMWAGCLAHEDASGRTVTTRAPPWSTAGITAPRWVDGSAWTDVDDDRVRVWLERTYGIVASPTTVCGAVRVASGGRAVAGVADYLRGLTWDGVARLDSWLSSYLGCASTPYAAAVGRWWMIAAVARALAPGCQADCMLILQGGQGSGKSSALRILAGDAYFSDQIGGEIGSKDSQANLAGRWIVELAELDALARAEETRVKAFLSITTDRYRPAYGRHVRTIQRSCVFAGTTNGTAYLRDPTGGRRFWPVATGRIDLPGLRDARDQLWAEARARYEAGERWWPDGADECAMCATEAEDRHETDPWEDLVASHVRRIGPTTRVSLTSLLEEVIEIPAGQRDLRAKRRVAAIMRRLGYDYVVCRDGEDLHRSFVRRT